MPDSSLRRLFVQYQNDEHWSLYVRKHLRQPSGCRKFPKLVFIQVCQLYALTRFKGFKLEFCIIEENEDIKELVLAINKTVLACHNRPIVYYWKKKLFLYRGRFLAKRRSQILLSSHLGEFRIDVWTL